jgi:maleylpyruvate isomerase
LENPYIPRVAAATEKLLATVAGLDDVAAAQPSLLPGWDRAMVVTHLAANAEGLARVVEAAREGRVAEMYPGGRAARDAAIEAGRARPAAELEQRLRQASAAVASSLASAPDAVSEAVALHPSGEVRVSALVVARLREVEVHHVDLACSYLPEDWPTGWVTEEMDLAMLALPSRLPPGVAVVMEATGSGQRWVAGSGDLVEVSGTPSEIFAWVAGRSATVAGRQCPVLAPWR